MKILFILFMFSTSLFAMNRPTNINIDKTRKGVFVDFQHAKYSLVYNLENRRVIATSTITFESLEDGFPIFDLTIRARNITIDGIPTKIEEVSLEGITKVMYIDKFLKRGIHTLQLTNNITTFVKFDYPATMVSSAFWMSDLSDREYLEQFLPTNLEYDQYQMSFEIEIVGAKKEHVIYNNGDTTKLGFNHFLIQYPKHFTTSSLYFHLTQIDKFKIETSLFYSMDGRKIEIKVYGKNDTNRVITSAHKILKELENDDGPWPHPSLLIYEAGQGGMEYCGATQTSFSSLGHELMHSYFARGAMPARGNAGWLDEAIASWRDYKYRQISRGDLLTSNMAAHSIYRRRTDARAYFAGRDLLSYLDKATQSQGGLKPFMRFFKNKRLFKPYLTADFTSDLQSYFKQDFQQVFDDVIFGKGDFSQGDTGIYPNPHHPKQSREDIYNLL